MRVIVVFLMVAVLFGKAYAARPDAVIPFNIDYGGWLTVGVLINGEGPYDFIIDTGATQSLVFQNLANKTPIPLSGGAPKTVLGLSSQGTFQTHLVGELQFGAIERKNFETVILPDWRIDSHPAGIIGLDLLDDYILVFDAAASELQFYAHKESPRDYTDSWNAIPLKPLKFSHESYSLYAAKGRIHSQSMHFILDLGASGTIINRKAAASLLSNHKTVQMRLGSRIVQNKLIDALADEAAVQSIIVNRLNAGRQSWRNHRILIHNAPIFAELGLNRKAYGLLGADLIRGRSFMLDLKGKEIRIGPIANPK